MTYGPRVAAAVAFWIVGTIVIAVTKITLDLTFRDVAGFSVTMFVSYFVTFAWIVKPRKLTLARLILTGLALTAAGAAALVASKFLAKGLN